MRRELHWSDLTFCLTFLVYSSLWKTVSFRYAFPNEYMIGSITASHHTQIGRSLAKVSSTELVTFFGCRSKYRRHSDRLAAWRRPSSRASLTARYRAADRPSVRRRRTASRQYDANEHSCPYISCRSTVDWQSITIHFTATNNLTDQFFSINENTHQGNARNLVPCWDSAGQIAGNSGSLS